MIQEKQLFGVVYCITNKVNGLRYVGLTTRTLEKRWKGHLSDARRGSKRSIPSAIREFGASAFDMRVIGYASSAEELGTMEALYIAEYGTLSPLGYNLVAGSGGAPSPETRRRMSAAKKGKKMSDAARAKMAVSQTGRVHSSESRANRSKALKGRVHSAEHLAKMSASRMGMRLSERAKAKISRPVIADGISYRSLKAAAQALGVSISAIVGRCEAGKPGYLFSKPAAKRVKMSEARRAAIIERESHPVIAEGKPYPSLTEAAAALGITRPGVAYRIKIGRQGYALADALKVAA